MRKGGTKNNGGNVFGFPGTRQPCQTFVDRGFVAQLKVQVPRHSFLCPLLYSAISMAMSILDVQVATDGIRKTREAPPRVSVYDVIAKVKGCSSHYAGNVFCRLLDAGNVPECEEISPNLVEEAAGLGGYRRPVLVGADERTLARRNVQKYIECACLFQASYRCAHLQGDTISVIELIT